MCYEESVWHTHTPTPSAPSNQIMVFFFSLCIITTEQSSLGENIFVKKKMGKRKNKGLGPLRLQMKFPEDVCQILC